MGQEKVQSVKVCVYDPGIPDEPIEEIQCYATGKSGLWVTIGSVTLPKKVLFYRYRIETKSESGIVNTLISIFSSDTGFTDEQGLRQLPGNIDVCSDIFRLRDKIQRPESVTSCLRNYFQALLDGATSRSMKRMLFQLEHMWRSFDEDFLINTTVKSTLCKWMEDNFSTCSQNPFQLVLLGVVYGKVVLLYKLQLGSFVNKYEGKTFLRAFDNVQREQLPSWSLPDLRETSLQILEETGKQHWVYAAAYFPFLFESSAILELESKLNKSEPHPDFAEKVLIPKIMEGYADEEAFVILKEMGKMYRFSDQAEAVRDLIHKLTMPQERFSYQQAETSMSSATSDLKVAGRDHGLEQPASRDAADEDDVSTAIFLVLLINNTVAWVNEEARRSSISYRDPQTQVENSSKVTNS